MRVWLPMLDACRTDLKQDKHHADYRVPQTKTTPGNCSSQRPPGVPSVFSSLPFYSAVNSSIEFPKKAVCYKQSIKYMYTKFCKGTSFPYPIVLPSIFSLCHGNMCQYSSCFKKKIVLEAGEISEWWRTCTTLTEDLSSNPSNHVGGFTTTCNSSSSGPHALFWTLRKLHSRVCKHMRMPLPGKDGKWSLSNWALSRTAGLHRHVYWRRKTTGGRSSSQSPSVHTPLVPDPFALPDGCCTLQSCGGAGRSQSHLQGAENTLKAVHSSSPSS